MLTQKSATSLVDKHLKLNGSGTTEYPRYLRLLDKILSRKEVSKMDKEQEINYSSLKIIVSNMLIPGRMKNKKFHNDPDVNAFINSCRRGMGFIPKQEFIEDIEKLINEDRRFGRSQKLILVNEIVLN